MNLHIFIFRLKLSQIRPMAGLSKAIITVRALCAEPRLQYFLRLLSRFAGSSFAFLSFCWSLLLVSRSFFLRYYSRNDFPFGRFFLSRTDFPWQQPWLVYLFCERIYSALLFLLILTSVRLFFLLSFSFLLNINLVEFNPGKRGMKIYNYNIGAHTYQRRWWTKKPI